MRFERSRLARVDVPHYAACNVTTFTLEADVRFHRKLAVNEEFTLVCKGGLNASAATFYLSIARGSDATEYYKAGFVDTTSGTVKSITTINILDADTLGSLNVVPMAWYYVAATYNHATKTLQIWRTRRWHTDHTGPNYAPTHTIDPATSLPHVITTDGPEHNAHPIRLGAGMNASAALEMHADVDLDEVRLWNVDKSADIDAGGDYLKTRLVGDEAGLIGYWRGDDNTGTTVHDRTVGGGNDGQMYGGCSWTDWPRDIWHAPADGCLRPGMALIGYHSMTERATITASSEAAGYPAERLRQPWSDRNQAPEDKVKTTRTANVTGAKTWVKSFGMRSPIVGFRLDGHNLTSAADIVIELHDADSWGSPTVQRQVTYHPSKLCYVFEAPQEFAFARLVITDAGNPDGYIEFGLCDWWLGQYLWQPPELAGVTVPIVDEAVTTMTAGRDQASRQVGAREDVAFALGRIARASAYELERHLRTHGPGGYWWLSLDPLWAPYAREWYGWPPQLGGQSFAGATGAYRQWGTIRIERDA